MLQIFLMMSAWLSLSSTPNRWSWPKLCCWNRILDVCHFFNFPNSVWDKVFPYISCKCHTSTLPCHSPKTPHMQKCHWISENASEFSRQLNMNVSSVKHLCISPMLAVFQLHPQGAITCSNGRYVRDGGWISFALTFYV